MRVAGIVAIIALGCAPATASTIGTSTAAFVDVTTFDGNVEQWQNEESAVTERDGAISSAKDMFIGIGGRGDPTFGFGDIDVWSQVSVEYNSVPTWKSSLRTSLNLDPLTIQQQGWKEISLDAFNTAVIRDAGVFRSPGYSGPVEIWFDFDGDGENFVTAGTDSYTYTQFATVDRLASLVTLDASPSGGSAVGGGRAFEQIVEAGEGRTDTGNIDRIFKLFPNGTSTLGERLKSDVGLGSASVFCNLNEPCGWELALLNTAEIDISTFDVATGNILRTQAEYASTFHLREVRVLQGGTAVPFTVTSELGIDYAGLAGAMPPPAVPLPASVISLAAGLALLGAIGIRRRNSSADLPISDWA